MNFWQYGQKFTKQGLENTHEHPYHHSIPTYLDLRGKKWIQKVVVGQQSARNRHEPDQEEITHADNLQDDDQIIDYVSVTRLQDVDDLEAPEEEVLAVVMADSDDDMFAGDD